MLCCHLSHTSSAPTRNNVMLAHLTQGYMLRELFERGDGEEMGAMGGAGHMPAEQRCFDTLACEALHAMLLPTLLHTYMSGVDYGCHQH